jgi:hypothetical protein
LEEAGPSIAARIGGGIRHHYSEELNKGDGGDLLGKGRGIDDGTLERAI